MACARQTRVFHFSQGCIHLWLIDCTSTNTSFVIKSWDILDSHEKKRASRFCRRLHQDRFIQFHGAIRRILGDYLCVKPQDLLFNYSPNGKPSLPQGPFNLEFNFSNSEELGILAISNEGSVGVDLEKIRNHFDWSELSESVCTQKEITWIREQSPELKAHAFYLLWTLKEARLKVEGLSLGGCNPQDLLHDTILLKLNCLTLNSIHYDSLFKGFTFPLITSHSASAQVSLSSPHVQSFHLSSYHWC